MPRRIRPNELAELWLRLPALRRGVTPPPSRWRTVAPYRLRYESNGGRVDDDQQESILRKFLETSATTLAALLMLGLGGYGYQEYYKKQVLRKIDHAFAGGLFSSLEEAALAQYGDAEHMFRIARPEQGLVDGIISGNTRGNYFLLFGEKGTGKSSMLLSSMQKVDGEGVAMFEAHSDNEVFRLRLGKALDYEYHEDYIGGLFSVKGPRDATPLLDIERALNKLEKIALQRRNASHGRRPLVLIISNIHHISDDVDGKRLLDLLQQRAELWAASGLVTLVFTSDKYRTTEALRLHATRMQLLNVQDVPRDVAVEALKMYRAETRGESMSSSLLDEIYSRVGGRLIFLDQVARSKNMLETAQSICQREQRWLLSQCWILGRDIDDEVEHQQDYCAAAMTLAQALVSMEKNNPTPSSLPRIALHKVQELMTRADFIPRLDQQNIIAIDADGMVRADSMPMQNAFRAICSQPGFDAHLEATNERLDELESLGRTTELTVKDLVDGGYEVSSRHGDGFVIRRR